jgi:hypothetical protein
VRRTSDESQRGPSCSFPSRRESPVSRDSPAAKRKARDRRGDGMARSVAPLLSRNNSGKTRNRRIVNAFYVTAFRSAR